MYSTLRYNQRKDTPIRLERQQIATSSNSGRGHQHAACLNCRAKKVRCSGEKAGCVRCRSKSLDCVYGKAPSSRPSSSREEREPSHPSSPSGGYSATQPSRSILGISTRGSTPRKIDDKIISFDANIISNQEVDSRNSKMTWPGDGMGGLNDAAFLNTSFTVDTDCRIDCPDGPRHCDQDIGIDWRQWLSGTEPILIPHGQSDPPEVKHDDKFNRWSDSLLHHHNYHHPPPPPPSSYLSSPSSSMSYPSSVGPSASSDKTTRCRCLPEMLQMLENLEGMGMGTSTSHNSIPSTIDGTLAFQHGLVERCSAMLECANCRSSSQQLVMMALVAEKLVAEYEQLQVSLFKLSPQRVGGASSRLDHPGPAAQITPSTDKGWMSHWPIGDAAFNFPSASSSISSYPSASEVHLVPTQDPSLPVLFDRHSKLLSCFIDRAKVWARAMRRETALSMFVRAETHLQDITLGHIPLLHSPISHGI